MHIYAKFLRAPLIEYIISKLSIFIMNKLECELIIGQDEKA